MTNLFELKKVQTDFPKVKITSSENSEKFIRNFYSDDIEVFESFFLLLLDIGNNTIGYAKISQGGITSVLVDVRIIAKYAIESLCSSVILCHNHPSGQLSPSQQDKDLTEKVVKALAIFDVKVLDHIIITKNNYASMADIGLI